MPTRKQIRDATKQLIQSIFNETFTDPPKSVDEDTLPAAVIKIEQGENEVINQDESDVKSTLSIEILGKNSTHTTDYLDDLANQINVKLLKGEALKGVLYDINKNGFNYEFDSDSFHGSLFLYFNIFYKDED